MENPFKASLRQRRAAISTGLSTWFEIGAIVLLMCASTLSSLGCSLLLGSEYQKVAEQRRHAYYKTAAAFESMLLERMFVRLAFVPVVLFVMWRSGEGWSRFGLVKPKVGKDILIGLGLWLAVVAFQSLIALVAFNIPAPQRPFYPVAVPWHRAILLVGGCCTIGFLEELICRAYLIPRLEAVMGSTWKSVLLSAVLFGFVHLYQGDFGVVGSFVSGLIWSIGFCLTRRIWPVAISHAVFDFIIYTHISSHVGL
jgi:membrane protease YdiL (CAAX protease family)